MMVLNPISIAYQPTQQKRNDLTPDLSLVSIYTTGNKQIITSQARNNLANTYYCMILAMKTLHARLLLPLLALWFAHDVQFVSAKHTVITRRYKFNVGYIFLWNELNLYYIFLVRFIFGEIMAMIYSLL
jgi:hypothetical protein